jgi:serine/threonine protein kinase
MPDALQPQEAAEISLTALAVEMGMITQQEANLTEARQKALRRGGIKMTLGQTLLERHFIEPYQIKVLMKEMERRVGHGTLHQNKFAGVPLKRFGPYELLEIISDKTHSRVIKARDIAMDRMVVLKILPASLKDDPQWSERFRRETTLLGKMAHPNLIQAFAAQEVEGCPVIAMEYVEGLTIGDRIENEGFFPEKEAWLIGREVAKALAYAARLGIIHRDIKPDNILSSRGGKIKLIDMGFSKSLTDTTHLTVEGTTVGTPFYISPEQARGTRDLDARTDVYSLGCTIFHMLTGSPPFWGDEITEVMLKHIECNRPDPRELIPQLTHASADLVMRMMAVRPDKRPQSADAVVEEINAILPALPKLFGPVASGLSSGITPALPPPRKRSDIVRIPAHVQSVEIPQSVTAAHVNGSKSARTGLWARIKALFGS